MLSLVRYCEQGAFGGAFQPVNTITNLAFIAAAVMLYLFFRTRKVHDWKARLFVVLGLVLAACSTLWHAYSTPFTFALDAAGIAAFFVVYVYLISLKAGGGRRFSIIVTAVYVIGLILTSLLFSTAPTSRFPSGAPDIIYTLLFIIALSLRVCRDNPKMYRAFAPPVLLALSAFAFRQADLFSCSITGIGTHFMWHILVAAAYYYAVKALYATFK